MKWPKTLTLIRHDTSAFNELKNKKVQSPLYQTFKAAYEKDSQSDQSKRLANEVVNSFSLGLGDHDTPLAENAGGQAKIVGEKLSHMIELPDIIFVSPYLRTHSTLDRLIEGWPELKSVETKEEERITEQDHGLSLIYNDWRVFNILYPEQKILHDIQGEYWYRFPQGENIPDLRERARDWLGALTRDYSDKNVLAVTHHLTILSLRANLERLNAEEFLRLDKEEKPINAGVTIYRGDKDKGSDGKLILEDYNLKLY